MTEPMYADLDEVRLAYLRRGDGPELVVLLHGWPQTSLCWRHVIPLMGDQYTVIAPDLRGYGRSGLAQSGYDKRATARDLGQLIRHLSWPSALVAAHDRGARVAHRWALDNPHEVTRLALIDILPTREVMGSFDRDTAAKMWHWFFHLQPEIPEILLAGNAEPYLRHILRRPLASGAIDARTFTEYVDAYTDPQRMAASLEDYRAGFGADLALDEADFAAGRQLAPPLLLLWGADGDLGSRDVIGVWRSYAHLVSGRVVSGSGHYVPEEQPTAVASALGRFFAGETM